jgi:hypothetical protein
VFAQKVLKLSCVAELFKVGFISLKRKQTRIISFKNSKSRPFEEQKKEEKRLNALGRKF